MSVRVVARRARVEELDGAHRGRGRRRRRARAVALAGLAALIVVASLPQVTGPAGANISGFTDVPDSNPFAADIAWMASSGITNGYPDGTFRPADPVQRKAMAAFLYRFKGKPLGDKPPCVAKPYTDIPLDHPFCGEIAWMKTTGITTGYPDGGFRPDGTVPRQAMAAFLYRYNGKPLGDPPPCPTAPFPDVQPGSAFCGEIAWLKGQGITQGYADGGFHGGDNIARQAMSAFLHRLAGPTVTTTSPANGVVGQAYSTTLTASGGSLPYTWSVTGGALPAGLSLSAAGLLSGSPSAIGAPSFTVQVTDVVGRTATTDLTVTVVAGPPAKPTGVSASGGSKQATVTWTAAIPNGTPVTGYLATASPGGAFAAAGPAATSVVVPGLTDGIAYTFTVVATSLAGPSPAGGPSNAVTPASSAPGAPTAVQAVAGNAQATVSWTAPATTGGAPITGYRVTPWIAGVAGTATTFASTATSQIVTGLVNGTAYTFTVAAMNSIGTGPASGPSGPVTPIGPPSPPTGVSATPGHQQATVSWTAPASTNGSPITGYTVTAAPGGAVANVGGGVTVANVTGLTNGTAYTFKVVATNAAGPSAASLASGPVTPSAQVPGAPTAVTAVAADGEATVSWVAPANNGGSAITGYAITTIQDDVPQGTVAFSSTAVSQKVTGLVNGASYTFTVAAVNAKGTGASSSASAPVVPAGKPGPPVNVSAEAGNTSAIVSWIAASSNGSPVTSYQVTAAPGGASIAVPGDLTTGKVTGLANGTEYTFTVVATNASGSGPASDPSAPVTPQPVAPGPPSGASAVAGDGKATVSWSAPSDDGGSAITGYVVTPYQDGSPSTALPFASTATTQVVSGLANGVSYTFTVAAVNALGTSVPSAPSAPVTPTGVPASAPTAVTATAGNTSAVVKWNAPTGPGSASIFGYVVTPYIAGVPQASQTFDSTATTQYVTGLTNGTSYTFKVAALNPSGTGALSASTAAVIPVDLAMHVCGTLNANTTWNATKVIVADCTIVVPAGITLTITAGATVKFTQNAGLHVEGTLNGSGTSGARTNYTSWRNDAIGGDTNGDGPSSGGVNDWTGLSWAGGGPVALAYANVSFGYGVQMPRTHVQGDPASWTVALSNLRVTAGGVSVTTDYGVVVTDTIVDGEGASGMVVTQTVSPWVPPQSMNVSRNDVRGGLSVDASYPGDLPPTVKDNKANGSNDFGLRIAGGSLLPTQLTGNTATGNMIDAMAVSGSLDGNLSVPTAGAPWVPVSPGLTVAVGVTLTMAPGSWMKFQGCQWCSSGLLRVYGTLAATGTAAQPITFTHLNDDSIGGDLNGDGSASSPQPWGGLIFEGKGNISLSYVNVRHGSEVNVNRTHQSGEPASWGVAFAHVSVAAAHTSIATDYGVSVTDSTFDGVGSSGLSVWQGKSPWVPAQPLEVSRNVVVGGLRIDTTDAALLAPTAKDNVITGTSGYAMTLHASSLLPVQLTGNTGSGSTINAMSVAGVLKGNLAVPFAGLPWVPIHTNTFSGLTVAAGVTLTMQPGSWMKFDRGWCTCSTLQVEGTLVATGTAPSPISFTSIRDDSVGGDTNNDGTASAPQPTDWGGISFGGAGPINLAYVNLTFAGTLAATRVHTSGEPAAWAIAFAHVRVTNGSINVSTDYGISIVDSRVDGAGGGIAVNQQHSVWVPAQPLEVSRNNVVGPISILSGDQANLAPTVKDNIIGGSTGYAMTVRAWSLVPSQLTGNTGSGNTINAIGISGNVKGNLTMPVAGLTWIPLGYVWPYMSGITIAAGSTLTMLPGSWMKFEGCAWCNKAQLTVEGTLVAVGTAAKPVTFTSLSDDTVGGDTNGDGTASSASPTDWNGLTYSNDGPTSLTYVDVKHSYGLYRTRARSAVEPASWAVSLSHVRVTNGGVAIDTDDAVSITDSVIDSSGVSVIQRSSVWVAPKPLTIARNNVKGPVGVQASDASLLAPTIADNTITGSTGFAVAVDAAQLLPAQLTGNTGSGNAINAIGVSGTLKGNLSLPVAGLRWIPRYGSTSGGLVVGEGTTLSLAAGEWLKFESSGWCGGCAYLRVQGTLLAQGTAQNPVTFTSLTDDTIGGDTNSDGTGTAGYPGAWGGIVFDGTGKGSFSGSVIRYANTALTTSSSGRVSFRGRIVESNWGGTSCVNCMLDVRNVDWGTASGPNPFGTGPGIDQYTVAIPWVGYSGPSTSVGSLYGLFGAQAGAFYGGAGVHTGGQWADPVNSASGAYTTEVTDASIAQTIGVPFSMVRSYTSNDPTVGPFGQGWTFSLGAKLTTAPNGDITFRDGNGQQLLYVNQGDGTYDGEAAARATLTKVGTTFVVVKPDQTTLTFTIAGVLTSIKDRNGKGLTLTYTSGMLSSVADASGRTYTFTSSAGRITKVTLPDSRSVSYGYTNTRLSSVTDLRGGTTSYTYDGSGRMLTVVDQKGHTVVTNSYGSDGRVIEQVDANGQHTTFAWDAVAQTATMTDPYGNVSQDVYSGGVLIERIDPLGHATSYTYDASLNVLSATDQNLRTTTSSWDERGNRLTSTTHLGHTTTSAYDAFNNVLTQTNPNGHTTTSTYDAQGNLVSTTNPAGATTTFGRAAGTGLVTSQTDPLGRVTTYAHDAAGNTTSAAGPAGTTTMTYDGTGRLLTQIEPGARTTAYAYDAADHRVTVTDPLGQATTTAYDAAGNKTSTTDPMGRVTAWGYDNADRVTSVTAPGGATTTLGLDALGRQVSRTDPNGRVTTWSLDAAGRPLTMTAPGGAVTTYQHDGVGNVLATVDPEGVVTTMSHDAENHLVAIDYSDATPDVTYGYDAAGRRSSMTDGTGTTSYGYDGADRLTGVTKGADTFSYTRDASGNISGTTYPDGTTIAYGHDNANRVTSMSAGGFDVTYTYDASSNLTGTTFPNGVTETRAYDAGRRTTAVSVVKGATPVFSAGYTYDSADNPTAVTGSSPSTATYDVRDRITAACFGVSCAGGSFAYSYDAVGNRLTQTTSAGQTTYAYDVRDRLTGTTGATTMTATYDQVGRQLTGPGTFTYDAAGRVTKAVVGAVTTTYAYDGDGRRVSSTSGGTTTTYLWDQSFPVPMLAIERTQAGALTRRWLHGAATVDGVLLGNGTARWLHHDAIGSTTAVTNGSGAKEWAFSYDPFGNALTASQLVAGSPTIAMRFAGEYLDSTGLYHLRARQFDPRTGRFLTPDPLHDHLTIAESTYVYAGNRPTVATDPTGLIPIFDRLSRLTNATQSQLTGPEFAEARQVVGLYGHGYSRIGNTTYAIGDSLYKGYAFGPARAWSAARLGHGLVQANFAWDRYGDYRDVKSLYDTADYLYGLVGRNHK